MTLTDESLNWLKEQTERSNPSWQITIESDLLHALLARLEVAEAIKSSHVIWDCECPTCKAWERAAGKD